METRLLGPDGLPIRRDVLTEELAAPQLTGVRTAWQEGVTANLNPVRLAAILKAADQGDGQDFLTMAEEMEEREPQYATVMAVRKRAIQGLDIQIDAASDDPDDIALADDVRELFGGPEIVEMIGDMLDALGKGFSVIEIMWETGANRWTPKAFIWRDPRFFQFDRLTGSKVRLRALGSVDGEPLAPYKFITHMFRLKSGQPMRGGLARLAAWSFLFKSFSVRDWASFLEAYGMPIRLGKYGQGASPEDQKKLLRAVRSIASDAAAIIPETMHIDFVSADKSGTGAGSSVFYGFASYLDETISKIVLGQTQTTDKGSNRAQAQVHDGIRKDILVSDARAVAATLKRDLVTPYIDLNYGKRPKYPNVSLTIRDNLDITTTAEALERLVPLGLEVQMSEVRDLIGFSDPEPNAKLLMPPAQPVRPDPTSALSATQPALNRASEFHAANCPCCKGLALNRAAPAPSEVDRIGAEYAAEWEPQLGPILAPIFEAVANATSLEALRDQLPELYDKMDTSEFERRLRAATAIARGLGDTGVN